MLRTTLRLRVSLPRPGRHPSSKPQEARHGHVPVFERLVEGDLADLGPHGGLSQLGDGKPGIPHPVGGLVRIYDSDVQHSVDLQRHVVRGDGGLVGDSEGLLLERVHVGDLVHQGDDEIEPRSKDGVELSKPLHHLQGRPDIRRR
eukprot:753025-Hanusia_phi.AAC.1